MIKEEFRVIEGFEDYYISNYGRILSRKFGKEKYLKPGLLKCGYFRVVLSKNSKYYKFLVHRLVLEAFVCKRPEGLECRHLDGNPQNNHVDNLKWGTKSENAIDKIKHGYEFSDETRRKIGEAHKGKIVSDEHRRKIGESNRKRIVSEETKKKISESLKNHFKFNS